MALRDLILQAREGRRSIDPVFENSIRDVTEKKVYHYTGLGVVNDQDFAAQEDALVIFKSLGKIEHVSVVPFRDESKKTLSFQEKLQYFRVRKLGWETGEEVEVKDEDETVTTVLVTNYGTLSDFNTAFSNPSDYGVEFQVYFDSMYLDLKDEVLGEFQTAFNAAVHPNN